MAVSAMVSVVRASKYASPICGRMLPGNIRNVR
jgi:hypothetical protein